jgi:hypothetical protein
MVRLGIKAPILKVRDCVAAKAGQIRQLTQAQSFPLSKIAEMR